MTGDEIIIPYLAIVSIHTPTQGVTVVHFRLYGNRLGFNPHTHAGCDSCKIPHIRHRQVSIHTPTQGVTRQSMLFHSLLISFNPHTHAGCDLLLLVMLSVLLRSFNPHTHAGCDCVCIMLYLCWIGFNPHTHAGCDCSWSFFSVGFEVSIHTPTQGVTSKIETCLSDYVFQSTHPRRV